MENPLLLLLLLLFPSLPVWLGPPHFPNFPSPALTPGQSHFLPEVPLPPYPNQRPHHSPGGCCEWVGVMTTKVQWFPPKFTALNSTPHPHPATPTGDLPRSARLSLTPTRTRPGEAIARRRAPQRPPSGVPPAAPSPAAARRPARGRCGAAPEPGRPRPASTREAGGGRRAGRGGRGGDAFISWVDTLCVYFLSGARACTLTRTHRLPLCTQPPPVPVLPWTQPGPQT